MRLLMLLSLFSPISCIYCILNRQQSIAYFRCEIIFLIAPRIRTLIILSDKQIKPMQASSQNTNTQ